MTTRGRWLLAVFLFASAGTIVELLFLGHVEDPWQWAPIALLAFGILAGGAVWRGIGNAMRYFRITLGAGATAGLVGMLLHWKSNLEFARELNPVIGGIDLVAEVLTGAMPALAPGHMVLLAALGFIAVARTKPKHEDT